MDDIEHNWDRGQRMRQTLAKLCNNGYRLLSSYARLRENLASLGEGNKTLFEDFFYRIMKGKYGQGSERELMSL